MSDLRLATRRRFLQMTGIGLASTCLMQQALAQDAFGQALIRGAGSTFVLPLVQRWLAQYRGASADARYAAGNSGLDGDTLGNAALDYEAIGSQAGLARLQAGAVDFALSELPLSAQELARLKLIQIPVVAGGVAIAIRLPGVEDRLQLDGMTLATILRGRITRWNDPAIATLNPGLALPDQAIAPFHRMEGSGTTYTLARYLATQDKDWREAIGVDAMVRWPAGTAVRGSAGMARALASTPGSIGYLDAVQAQNSGLGIVRLKNSAGMFVAPETSAIEAATHAVPWQASRDAQPRFIDAPGDASYPIVATVLAVLNEASASRADRRARAFLAWALENGQNSARDLGYVALPAAVARQVREQLMTTASGASQS